MLSLPTRWRRLRRRRTCASFEDTACRTRDRLGTRRSTVRTHGHVQLLRREACVCEGSNLAWSMPCKRIFLRFSFSASRARCEVVLNLLVMRPLPQLAVPNRRSFHFAKCLGLWRRVGMRSLVNRRAGWWRKTLRTISHLPSMRCAPR